MEIINNLNGNNHEEVLWYLLNGSSEFVCCSPFLNQSVDLFEAAYNKRIHLITTLKPNKAEQIEKVEYFNYLFNVAKKNSLDVRISIDNRLHGKVYISKDGDSYIRAVVTSANFTTAGMKENHEWGISIEDQTSIAEIERQVVQGIEYSNITENDLHRFKEEIEKRGYNYSKQFMSKNINLQLVRLLDKDALIEPYFASKTCAYWLKPLGSKDHPFPPDGVLVKENQRLDFANRPSGVAVGDVVICYGVGVRKVLAVILITDKPRMATAKEMQENEHLKRWKWCMYGKNMTPQYGCEWNNHNLTLRSLENAFLDRYPEELLTKQSQSLGSLRWHSDKVRLNPNFAFFIIGKIMDRNF